MTIIPPARVPALDVDLRERRFVPLRSNDVVGVVIEDAQGPRDADGPVSVTWYDDSTGVGTVKGEAEHLDVGTYGYTLDPHTDTSQIGLYSVAFTYTADGTSHEVVVHLDVSEPAPAYDALPEGMKAVVDEVWIRFADIFDSPQGGPHLQVYLQSHFGRNRMAQLLRQAIGRLNIVSQPFQTYTIDGPFPFAQWGSLLVQALYVETLKHLVRSYVETPDTILATSISRNDRRDYYTRWQTLLRDEQDDLKVTLDMFKMANMNLGGVSVMVSGGAFGNMGPTVTPLGMGHAAARGYLFARGGY